LRVEFGTKADYYWRDVTGYDDENEDGVADGPLDTKTVGQYDRHRPFVNEKIQKLTSRDEN
jgi:hypothetical protein